ncbi:MAG: hypothetical protein R3B72_51020 [Polyangiaceae bacterium]
MAKAPLGGLLLESFDGDEASLRHELERALSVAHRTSNAELVMRDGRASWRSIRT